MARRKASSALSIPSLPSFFLATLKAGSTTLRICTQWHQALQLDHSKERGGLRQMIALLTNNSLCSAELQN